MLSLSPERAALRAGAGAGAASVSWERTTKTRATLSSSHPQPLNVKHTAPADETQWFQDVDNSAEHSWNYCYNMFVWLEYCAT